MQYCHGHLGLAVGAEPRLAQGPRALHVAADEEYRNEAHLQVRWGSSSLGGGGSTWAAAANAGTSTTAQRQLRLAWTVAVRDFR